MLGSRHAAPGFGMVLLSHLLALDLALGSIQSRASSVLCLGCGRDAARIQQRCDRDLAGIRWRWRGSAMKAQLRSSGIICRSSKVGNNVKQVAVEKQN